MHTGAQPVFRILGQVSSLSRSNSYVCSYENAYPIITKLIVVFRSRTGDLPSTLTTRIVIITIKQTALLNYALTTLFTLASRKSEKLYK